MSTNYRNPDNKTPLPEMKIWELAMAVKHLGDALAARRNYAWQTVNEASRAHNYLSRFFDESSDVERTEEESEWSASLHTWLRKCDDSHIGCVIYNFWDRQLGANAWFTLVRLLMKKKLVDYDTLVNSHPESFETRDDQNMWSLLLTYASIDDGWVTVQKGLREWNK